MFKRSLLEARPNLPHMATSPDLTGFRSGFAGDPCVLPSHHSDSGKPAGRPLLEVLNDRSNELYKTVTFSVGPEQSHNYQQRVSFDTINLQANEDDFLLDFSDDDLYLPTRRPLNDMDYRGRGRDRELRPAFVRSPGTSPATSPTRMLSPVRGAGMARFFQNQNQQKYPTRPLITRRGCTFTRMHRKFEDLYLGNSLSEGLCPVLPGRVILVYISGRQHTWVALDWILRSFVEQGDTVIIATAINHSLGPRLNAFSNYPTPSVYQAQTPKVRQRQRNRPEYIKQIAANVMEYAMKVVNPDIIAKITVEICEGTTKEVIKDMYKLYEPNIVSTGLKVNARNSAPLKSWHSSRLSDRLVKNFPLPVIVVPALNMAAFEKDLKDAVEGVPPESISSSTLQTLSYSTSMSQSASKKTEELNKSSMNIIDDHQDVDSLSDGSLHSVVSSTESVSLSESYTSYDEIAELFDDYRHDLHHELHKLTAKDRDDQYFANFLRAISDKSLAFCEELRTVNPDFRGQGAKLARAITGSNSFGAVPFKTKSLLMPLEEKPRPQISGGISYKDLKRNLKQNAMRSEAANSPMILVDPPSTDISPTSTPKPTALKFSEMEKPSRRRKSTAPLKKFLSHEDKAGSKEYIEPSKSHPDLRSMDTTDSDKKKKKKKFWRLF